ncbi:MAG: hypothetical protein AB9907_14220 [Flexilinea sp.]
MTWIQETTWYNFSAFMLESEKMSVIIVPDLGAKIVSIYDKVFEREWLVPPMRPLKQISYGQDFVSQDMSGWDEMMPTIAACQWEEASLPDHGEVWSVPWQIEDAADKLKLSVSGTAIPYRFTRTASLEGQDCLALDYEVVNKGINAFPWLWAAHPQFAADSNTRILLPETVKKLVNVIDHDSVWGRAGACCDWPVSISASGEPWQLDKIRGAEKAACRKFYLPPEQHIEWAALEDELSGCRLSFQWDKEEIPYLGLWIDEGMYNILPVAAFEPSSGYYDSLETAVSNQMVPYLMPEHTASWKVKIKLNSR